MAKNVPQPRKEDQIRPDALVKVIRKETEDRSLKDIPVEPGNYKKFKGNNRPHLPKGIIWGLIGIAALFIIGIIVSFTIFKAKVKDSITANVNSLQAGVADLENFDTTGAATEFSSLSVSSTFSALFGSSDVVGAFTDFSKQLIVLTSELQNMKVSAVGFLTGGTGGQFSASLSELRDTVDALQLDSAKLSAISSVSSSQYLAFASQIGATKQFLDAFAPWLASSTPHHVLVLFDNPSELRPGGGFLGSYADVTVASGSITDISTHDVNDVDNAFAPNIIPPKPLQIEVKAFRPADTNWFFGYPTSASKTIDFFNESSLYASSSETFDAAIAITPQVVSDILALTGPVTVGTPTTTFTASNFLVQVQKIVQNGQATDATYPKKILSNLGSAMFAKLSMATSSDDTAGNLLTMGLNWIQNKDVMIYSIDPTIENYIDTHGASGATYGLTQRFNGDYLAIADADINAAKTELYISSTVTLTDNINADGTLSSQLVIDRTNHGNQSPYSWYNATNQDYIQLYLPNGTTIGNASGGSAKKIVALTNYAQHGYVQDPLVSAIESTDQSFFSFPSITLHQEDNKEIFSTWSSVKPGATTELSFDYSHRLFLSPDNGVQYQFIFEKQAGSQRSYDFTINAPLGYVFAENGLPAYEYKSNDPPGQLIVTLTLQKIAQ